MTFVHATEPEEKPVCVMEEIVVLAQKQEEKLQNVPITNQTFSGDGLEISEVRYVNDRNIFYTCPGSIVLLYHPLVFPPA
ncbi:hypothetical protein ACFL6N_01770 [Thermodesulfobacteriota bacterium]